MTSLRTITSTNQTATLASVVRPIAFARLVFAAGVQRFHTEIGPRTATHPVHGAEIYTGIGDFGGFTADIVESIASTSQAIKLAISGVSSSLVTSALTDDYYRRDAELMLGFDDADGDLLDDPIILWSGFMDKVDITLGEGTANMVMTCESRATNLQGASDLRFTDEDLQAAVTGDLGGEYIFRMVDLQLKWGGDQIRSGGGSRRGFASPGGSTRQV